VSPAAKGPEPGRKFPERVGREESRRLSGGRDNRGELWRGWSLLGLVGWTVSVPVAAGALLGLWLDRVWPMPHSWTLTLILVGLIAGILNAWWWLRRQRRGILEQLAGRRGPGREDRRG